MPGGAGKTRLSLEIAAQRANEHPHGIWFIDLAPITDPDTVAITAARSLGLPDQSGPSPVETLIRFIGERRIMVVLDNCEHLVDASARLVTALLIACPGLASGDKPRADRRERRGDLACSVSVDRR